MSKVYLGWKQATYKFEEPVFFLNNRGVPQSNLLDNKRWGKSEKKEPVFFLNNRGVPQSNLLDNKRWGKSEKNNLEYPHKEQATKFDVVRETVMIYSN